MRGFGVRRASAAFNERLRTTERRRRAALQVSLATLAAFVLVTIAALEGPEVVVLRTRDGAGRRRATRTWIADHEGRAWIEVANLERPFYRDVPADADVELVRGGQVLRLRAMPLPPDQGHPLIRRLLAEK
jgi:hypothetical protein